MKKSKQTVTKKDLKSHTLEELMTKYYGKKGTKKRIAADKRIKKLSNNLEKNNEIKAKKEIKMKAK